MRWRALVLTVVALLGLACMGTVDDDGEGNGKEPGEAPGGDNPGWLDQLPGMGGDTDDTDPEAGDGDGDGDGGSSEPGGSPKPVPTNPPAGIHQVNDTTWEVSSAKRNQVLNSPGKFASAKKKPKGYELRGVKSGGDAWWAGLRNGDVVKTVNGYQVADQVQALQAYSEVQSAKTIRVKLKRGESTLNHTYKVVD